MASVTGVEVGIHDDNSKDRILIVGSVQFEGGAAKVLALGEDLQAALRILAWQRGSSPPSFVNPAPSDCRLVKLRFRMGTILNVLVVKGGRHVGAVGLQLGSLCGDFDGFGRSADLELAVHARAGVGGDN